MSAAKYALDLKTPLKDKLLVSQMKGHEGLGRLFQFDLDVTCENPELHIDDILGQNVTLHFDTGGGEMRYFNGIVSSFSLGDQLPTEGAAYRLTLRPWLWFLTRTSDCRIFQDESVPDIIKAILSERGFPDVEDKLNESHKPWSYCVQYRETDFNFISRLMEEEGIYYYFKHEDGKHTLVLADSGSAHKKIREEALIYYTKESGVRGDVTHWSVHAEVQPGAFASNDYDYKRPKAVLRVREQKQENHAGSEYEIYDYPGEYAGRFEGTKGEYADIRIQELHVRHTQAEGVTDLSTMAAGGLFKLEKYPRKDQNKEYLVIQTAYDIAQSLQAGGDAGFECQFTVIDGKTPYRPSRVTPKPVVQGPQTAVVIDAGPDPDGYGRVRVQFFWDREGQDSGGNACWVRVAQNSAGSGWGSYFPPHIGHEVIISFLEGDPDQPLITGRVYNADNLPDKLWSGTIDNSVITDHVENKINLDGASVPIIHITQPSGNEILMNNDEGIQIRDHYGNEIIMDAQAGTIMMRSPTHESYCIFGKSLVFSTDSDKKTWVNGKEHKHVTGSFEAKVLDFTSEIFVGAKHSSQLATTLDTFVGMKTSFSMALDISSNKDKKVFKDKIVEHILDKHMDVKAKNFIHQSVDNTTRLNMMPDEMLLESGDSMINIRKDADIVAQTKTKMGLSGDSEVSITAKSGGIKMRAGSGGLKIKSQGEATINGQTIKIG
jgi:type VI secretion system secreted protein VgrG